MAKARQIIKRRKAVQNIRKITRTMQLVATARFQQAFNRAMAGKPYTQKITQLVSQLAQAQGQINHPLLQDHPDAPADMMLVISSNRGLCGSYNSNVLHASIARLRSAPRPTELHVVGKKGIAYFKFLRQPVAEAITNISDRPQFDQIEPIADRMM